MSAYALAKGPRTAGRCEHLKECRVSRLAAHGRSRLQQQEVPGLARRAGQQES